MNFSLSSKAITATKTDCLVVALPEKGKWPETTTATDEALGGLIKQLEKAGDLTGKNASVNTIPLVDQPWQRLVVVGTGKDTERTPANFGKALIARMGALKDGPPKNPLTSFVDTPLQGADAASNEEAGLNRIGGILEASRNASTGSRG